MFNVWYFLRFPASRLDLYHLVPWSALALSLDVTSSWLWPLRYIWWSSANIDMSVDTHRGRSFWKIFHNEGPRTEPWGQPLFTSRYELTSFPILTHFASVTKVAVQELYQTLLKTVCFKLSSKGGWSVSKAFDMSVERMLTTSLLSLAFLHDSIRLICVVSQLWCLRYALEFLYMRESKPADIYEPTSFSMILFTYGTMVFGR